MKKPRRVLFTAENLHCPKAYWLQINGRIDENEHESKRLYDKWDVAQSTKIASCACRNYGAPCREHVCRHPCQKSRVWKFGGHSLRNEMMQMDRQRFDGRYTQKKNEDQYAFGGRDQFVHLTSFDLDAAP